MERGELEKNGSLLPYILAGRVTVTLENKKTGGRFTYQVHAPFKETEAGGFVVDYEAKVRFVKVLVGPDNKGDYAFLGTVFLSDNVYRSGHKSSVSPTAQSSVAWQWFWKRLTGGQPFPPALHVYHEGRCARCGRKLTVPESIRTGYGPDCRAKVGDA